MATGRSGANTSTRAAARRPLSFALDHDAPHGLIEQLVEHFEDDMDSGRMRAGARLPSVRALADTLGISVFSVVEAYERLKARNRIEARTRRGYFVAQARAATVRAATPVSSKPPVLDSEWLSRRVFEDNSGALKPGCGWLPEQWLDADGVKGAMREMVRRAGARLVRYGHPLGYAPLRQFLRDHLARQSIEADTDRIVLTSGASQGLDIAMHVLLKPGDAVLVDEPMYSNLLQALRGYGARPIGVPRGLGGPDAEALRARAKESGARVFFTNSTLHNPTGTSLSPANAHAVLRVAETEQLLVVEDDPFAELALAPPPTLAALDGGKRVIYVSSFSKSISPSLRVGYAVVPEPLIDAFVARKMLAGLTSSELLEMAVLSILANTGHRRFLQRLRERLARAQGEVGARLEGAGWRLFHRPAAGLFVWAAAPTGLDRDALAAAAMREGIWLAPGQYYETQPSKGAWFRFNVAFSDNPKLWKWLQASAR